MTIKRAALKRQGIEFWSQEMNVAPPVRGRIAIRRKFINLYTHKRTYMYIITVFFASYPPSPNILTKLK